MDDVLFDFLHMEMTELICGQNNKDEKQQSGQSAATLRAGQKGDSKELNLSCLEQIGFSTGYRFVEKLTKDWQRFKDELDVMKFICKEFWWSVFKKQMDTLRTNHQGTYVLIDNRFRFLTHISASKQFVSSMPKYLAFSCGIIRGALANLGISAIVTAEILSPPCVRFQVQMQRNQ